MAADAVAEVEEVRRALERLGRSLVADAAGPASRAQWAALVAECQGVVNSATAVQHVAITRLVAIEEEWLEDGTTAETRHADGHVALDGPDVVAGALGVSHVHAQRRTALAVRLVAPAGGAAGEESDGGGADGAEVDGAEVDGGEVAEADLVVAAAGGAGLGLSALHTAMVRGDLDSYRAGVVVEELEEAPPEVAEAVVAVLAPHLTSETPVHLRRRCRRALARISPDLLRQRAKRARQSCALRRWVDEPGVDRWEGTFPSEQAAEGWAAVDALAHRYVAEGRCSRVASARAQALMDLIRGQASIDVELVLTVPVAVAGTMSDRDLGAGGETVASPVAETASRAEAVTSPVGGRPVGFPLVDMARADSRPMTADAAVVSGSSTGARAVTSRSQAGRDEVPGDDIDDLVEVWGPLPGEPVLVGRRWITQFVAVAATVRRPDRGKAPGGRPTVRRRAEECDVATGSLLGSALRCGAGYRPARRVAALVRTRDGRCRFPGCSVAARFCDLDHVRPWPSGPTSTGNLMCLCRRHHRIKQRPGWTVRLAPDGRAVWTDPTGRVRSTLPRNLLDAVILPAPRPEPMAAATRALDAPRRSGRRALRSRSSLEVLLEVLTDPGGPTPAGRPRFGHQAVSRAPVTTRVCRPARLLYGGARPGHAGGGRTSARLRASVSTRGGGEPPPF